MKDEVTVKNGIRLVHQRTFCSKRMIYYVEMDNHHDVIVADVGVFINPFHQSDNGYYCTEHSKISHPHMHSQHELEAYDRAIFEAGRWLGEAVTIAKQKI